MIRSRKTPRSVIVHHHSASPRLLVSRSVAFMVSPETNAVTVGAMAATPWSSGQAV